MIGLNNYLTCIVLQRASARLHSIGLHAQFTCAMINTMAFTIFHILMVLFPQPLIAQSLHSEAHEAKSLVDSLSFKLHHQLNELKNLHQKTAQQISETKQELVTVKKVQTLLAQLSGNQKRLGNTCEDEYFVPGYFYRQKIMIESSSALPVHYTIQVTGTS